MHLARSVWTYGLTHEMVAAATAAVERTGRSSERTSVVKPLSLGPDFDAAKTGCVVALLNAEAEDPSELLSNLARRQSPLIVVYLIEQPATKVIVEAMRKGAVDVIEWPAERDRLGATIELAIEASMEKERRLAEVRTAQERLQALAPGELEVLKMMLDGKVNKNIAIRLGIALRTVEARRKRVLEKMGTHSLSEIAGALHRAGLLGRTALSDAPTEADD